jgi:hypothetical protein
MGEGFAHSFLARTVCVTLLTVRSVGRHCGWDWRV